MVKARKSSCCPGRIRLQIGRKEYCVTRLEALTLAGMILRESETKRRHL